MKQPVVKRENWKLFIILLSKLKYKSVLYYKSCYWLIPFCAKDFSIKNLRVNSLLLTFKSLFLAGIKRDVLRLNLFLYKFFFFWERFFFNDISVSNKLKASFLRSVFADNSSKLQYEAVMYTCQYAVTFSNIWFLFYFVSTLFKKNIIKYSKIKADYSITITVDEKEKSENDKNQ